MKPDVVSRQRTLQLPNTDLIVEEYFDSIKELFSCGVSNENIFNSLRFFLPVRDLLKFIVSLGNKNLYTCGRFALV